MKKNQLVFSEDGTECKVVFKNEKESDTFYTKEAAFNAIVALGNKNKIEPADFKKMRDQILEEKNLPWSESDLKSKKTRRRKNEGMGIDVEVIEIGLGGPGGFGSLFEMLAGNGEPRMRDMGRGFREFGEGSITDFLASMMGGMTQEHDSTVEVAVFNMCECGAKRPHGKIFFKNRKTMPFMDKETGKRIAESLKEDGSINNEEFEKVSKEIDESVLVPTPKEVVEMADMN